MHGTPADIGPTAHRRFADDVYETVELLAASYVAEGKSIPAAARLAAGQLVNNHADLAAELAEEARESRRDVGPSNRVDRAHAFFGQERREEADVSSRRRMAPSVRLDEDAFDGQDDLAAVNEADPDAIGPAEDSRDLANRPRPVVDDPFDRAGTAADDDDLPDFEFLDGPDTGLTIRRVGGAEAKAVSPRHVDDLSVLVDDADATGEEPPDELVEELGELVLSVLPVSGEVLSARDAYLAAIAARRALDDGDLAAALEKGGISAVHALGALPFIGAAARSVRAVAKAAPILAKLLRRAKRSTDATVETAARAGRTVSKRWFARWSDKVLASNYRALGQLAGVGKLNAKARTALNSAGIALKTDGIVVSDKELIHMIRAAKKARLPNKMIRDLPRLVGKPRAILHDKGKRDTLLYVFDVPGDPRLGKFVVRVNINQKVRTPTGNRRRTVNSVRSGGMVARRNLIDPTHYDLVDGRL